MTFLLLCRTAASDPFTTAWLNPMSMGSKIDQPQKECPCRAQPLPTSETTATGSTADASLLRKGSSDVLDRTFVLCPVDLGLRRRVSGALFKNEKKQAVGDGGHTRVLLFDILS